MTNFVVNTRKYRRQEKQLLFFQKQPSEVFYKKVALKNFAKFTGKHPCQSLFLKKQSWRSQSVTLIKTETLAWVFSCEFCKIYNYSFSAEYIQGDCFSISISISQNPSYNIHIHVFERSLNYSLRGCLGTDVC